MNTQEELQLTAIRALRQEISINDYGLPVGIYRVDMLPFHNYVPIDYTKPQPQVAAAQEFLPGSTSNYAVATSHPSDRDDDIDDLDEEDLDDTYDDVDPGIYHNAPGEDVPLDVDIGVLAVAPSATPIEHRTAGFLTEDLRNAFMPLDFMEGFPTFRNGDPFWLQLIYEPAEAYHAFHRYLQMSATAAADMPSFVNTSSVHLKKTAAGATGFRSIAKLAAEMQSSDSELLSFQEQLKVWSEMYYWEWRAKAYDHFRVARHRQQQEIRAIETQDSHYSMARRITAKLLEYVEHNEDFMDQMTPKVAFDGLKLATALERVSAGLPASGPLREDSEGNMRVTSMEMTMRRIGQSSKGNEEEIAQDDGSALLTKALESPQDLAVLQEMILRVHSTSVVSTR